MSQGQDARKKFGSGNLDAYFEIFKDRSQPNNANAASHNEIIAQANKVTNLVDRVTRVATSNAGARYAEDGKPHQQQHHQHQHQHQQQHQQQQQQHETFSFETFRSRGSSVVEGLPPQKRSGEQPRGSSSSSSSDSPMFEIPRPNRKSGEIFSRVSISSGASASFSGEIPRASCSSSSGDILDPTFRSQKRTSGEIPRASHSSSGSCNGESPTPEGMRAAANRKSGEIYHAGNSSGGSSSGGSPTPGVFNRGRKSADGAHGSNSSAGSSDGGGSPTSDSLWGGKAGAAMFNGGMVTGGSFSSFSAVTNGNADKSAKETCSEARVSSNSSSASSNSTSLQNGGSGGASATRFLVGTNPGVTDRNKTTSAPASNRVGMNGGAKAGPPRGNIVFSSSEHYSHRGSADLSAEDVKAAGNIEYKKGNFPQALALYDRAIALCPDQAAYRCNRAAALAGLGRLAEAIKESEMAIKLDPAFSRAHQRLASLYLRLGQIEEAKKHLKAAGQQNDAGDAQRAAAVEKKLANSCEARKLRDWSRVVKECDGAIVAGADSAVEVYVMKAEALLKLQRLDEADAVLLAARRVEDASPRSTRKDICNSLLVLRAQIDMAQGRFDEAVAVTERAARLEPRNVEISSLLRKARTIAKSRSAGNDFFKSGKYFEACAAYTEGLELEAANAVLLCNRAASRSKLGQWEKSLEDCNAALRVQPNYTKALLRRAHSYTKLERWEDAVRDYEALRREHPGDVEVAHSLFEVQVCLKRSRGEEICKTRFGGVEEVSRNDQFREAVSCPGLSVVEFTTRWSDRCRQFSGFVDELCRQYPSVNFSKVDVDDNPYLAQMESINSVPTFKIFRNGVKVRELLGPSQQGLEQAVKQCGV